MSRKDIRESIQRQRDVDAAKEQAARPNQPPSAIREQFRCPSRIGREHDFTMKGPDGVYRCWFCVKTRGDLGLKCNACGREGHP
jgi:hypothetical protein